MKSHLTRHMVYNRVKFVMQKAGLVDVSTHDLRRTAGAWYYIATRDIFATSRFLGHSSVKVTERYYAGLIQSLQVEYARMFEDTIKKQVESRLLHSCYFETKPDQSRHKRSQTKRSPFSSEKGGYQGAGPTRFELATSGLTGRRSNQAELRSLIFALRN